MNTDSSEEQTKFAGRPATPRSSGPHRRVNPSISGKYLPILLLCIAIGLFILATWLFR